MSHCDTFFVNSCYCSVFVGDETRIEYEMTILCPCKLIAVRSLWNRIFSCYRELSMLYILCHQLDIKPCVFIARDGEIVQFKMESSLSFQLCSYKTLSSSSNNCQIIWLTWWKKAGKTFLTLSMLSFLQNTIGTFAPTANCFRYGIFMIITPMGKSYTHWCQWWSSCVTYLRLDLSIATSWGTFLVFASFLQCCFLHTIIVVDNPNPV